MGFDWGSFAKCGYSIQNVEDLGSYKDIKRIFLGSIDEYESEDIESLHKGSLKLHAGELNNKRISALSHMNATGRLREGYIRICRDSIREIFGPDICIQRKINLSIQLPDDESSLLAMHADTWSGDSPFEVVVWLPLMHARKTASMYIVPAHRYGEFLRRTESKRTIDSDKLFEVVSDLVEFIECPEESYVIFNQCLPHGNVINKEGVTRVSMNCRFKSLFSPFGHKKLGDFFEIASKSPLTCFALDYSLPRL